MNAHLRAGIAIYNADEYHAAHDAWEEYWLDLESGTDDERLLHGLIQYTAAIYHARNRNWAGATGLAESAIQYLQSLSPTYRGVAIDVAISALTAIEADPESIERREPQPLIIEGSALALADLDFEETCLAATVLANEYAYDEQTIERAIAFAHQDMDSAMSSPLVGLLFSFVRDSQRRPIIFQRLAEHTDRRRQRDGDVSGLFDDTTPS